MSITELPIIALTQGDPAGIGPELCLKVIRDPNVLKVCRPIIIGDRSVLDRVGQRLDLLPPTGFVTAKQFASGPGFSGFDCSGFLLDCELPLAAVEPGVAAREGGLASYRYIELAAQLA